jgi:hypothetical protein
VAESTNSFTLCCDFWAKNKKLSSSDQGTIPTKPVPLSYLMRVFGVVPGAPWFNEAIDLIPSIANDVDFLVPQGFNHSKYFYRLQIYGDGMARFKRSSLRWGLTEYVEGQSRPRALLFFDEVQKKTLQRNFKENSFFESKYPFQPICIRIDRSWEEDFLSPLGISLGGTIDSNAIFFDMWFNVDGPVLAT